MVSEATGCFISGCDHRNPGELSAKPSSIAESRGFLQSRATSVSLSATSQADPIRAALRVVDGADVRLGDAPLVPHFARRHLAPEMGLDGAARLDVNGMLMASRCGAGGYCKRKEVRARGKRW